MAINLAVLLSGSGTTFQYMCDRAAEGGLDARVAVVIGSRPDAYGLERAARLGIPRHLVNRADFKNGNGARGLEEFNKAMLDVLSNYEVNLVALAGFLSLITPEFVKKYPNAIMNTHPALIPAFCGKNLYGHHVHQAVIDFGAKISGVTIHFIDEQYDHGPVILQEAAPVLDDDTADTLAARVQAVEKPLYCKAIQLFAEGRLEVRGRKVRIRP